MAGSYKYVLELFGVDGRSLRQALIEPDWLPAKEAGRFEVLRSGQAAIAEVAVEPIWHAEHGQPNLSGVRATAAGIDGAERSVDIPLVFFRPYAQELGHELVETGALAEGDQFVFGLQAYPAPEAAKADATGRLHIEKIVSSPVSGRRDIGDLNASIEATEGAGDEARLPPGTPTRESAYPVFVPRRLLAEAEDLKRQAGKVETGGILIGHLHEDDGGSGLFAEITALLPARNTIAESMKLTFTAETWADVLSAIDLRGRDEIMLGWFHTHPARSWCTCVDPEKQQNCPLARQFFSKDDCLVHRTVFFGAHQVAVVLGDEYRPEAGWQSTCAAYGWDRGVIVSRTIYVVGDEPVNAGRHELTHPADAGRHELADVRCIGVG